MSAEILIVDDEADIRDLVAGILQDEGYVTRTARNSDEALAAIVARRPNLVFLDIWLQGSKLDGLQLLNAFKREHPEMPVVMISGHGNIETAVAAIKHGAYDFIEKPFKADRLVLVAERALETSRLKREVKALKQFAPSAVVGKSSSMNQLRQTVEKIAPTNSRILIVGPAGAGKELAARAIHAHSARANGPFIVINAAAMMPERMELEMFGVELPTDGQGRKVGALEEAELRAQARIEVEQLVLAVAGVQAPVEIADPAEPDGAGEPVRSSRDLGVRARVRVRRDAGVGRPGPQLASGENDVALAEVRVRDPVLRSFARKVLLDNHARHRHP
jgi:FixJ family two-component response regulator